VLGTDIVAEPEQGPTQRFHSECWKKHVAGERKPLLEEDASASRVGNKATKKVPSVYCLHRSESPDTCVVTAYVDEWKRTAMEPSKRSSRSSRSLSFRALFRSSPLDGLISVANESGERHVARGFSKSELQTAMARWSCEPAEGDDCAICLANPEQPVRLPCGHVFCTQCVAPWLRKCALCPMCRKDLHSSSDVCGSAQPSPATLVPTPRDMVGIRSARTSKCRGQLSSVEQ
jgi:hypothetical protein